MIPELGRETERNGHRAKLIELDGGRIAERNELRMLEGLGTKLIGFR